VRIVQTLTLKNNPSLIAEYIDIHKKVWPEIQEGIRSVGITNMEIYINGCTCFMIIDTVDDFDREAAFARLATLPRQAEWEEYVAKFQDVAPGATSGEKWREAEKVFCLNVDSLIC
jgi:L-rhamnose mutarotase